MHGYLQSFHSKKIPSFSCPSGGCECAVVVVVGVVFVGVAISVVVVVGGAGERQHRHVRCVVGGLWYVGGSHGDLSDRHFAARINAHTQRQERNIDTNKDFGRGTGEKRIVCIGSLFFVVCGCVCVAIREEREKARK